MPDSSKTNRSHRVIQYLLWLVLGTACFPVSQPLLRIPPLGLLNHSMWFAMFNTLYPVLAMAIIGLPAGVLERGFRFLSRQFLPRPAKYIIARPLLSGLSHGGIEARPILIPLPVQGCTLNVLHMALIERVFAMLLHLILVMIVWDGFQTGHRFHHLAAVIILHGLVDSVLPLLTCDGMQMIFAKLIFAGMVLRVGARAVLSRKLHL